MAIPLDDSMRNLVAQALVLAASNYVEFAADAEQMANGESLAEQFRMQAIQARKIAILVSDADAVHVFDAGSEFEAHEDARKITAQQVIDVRKERERLAGVALETRR